MNTTKTLALAALTALSLGVGTAMAQESSGPIFYQQPQSTVTVPGYGQSAPAAVQPQSGSSDVDQSRNSVIPQSVPLGADGNG